MIEAEITTSWTGTGTQEDSNRPMLAEDYQIQSWEDTTGQPSANLQPDPNIYIIKVKCTDKILTDIKADSKYAVLWSGEISDELEAPEPISNIDVKPTLTELAAKKSELTSLKVPTEILNKLTDKLTRKESTVELQKWMKGLKKKNVIK